MIIGGGSFSRTQNGKIASPDYIQNEQGDWLLFDHSIVQQGKAEIGDEVEFEVDRRTKNITKVWLYKELGNEVASSSHVAETKRNIGREDAHQVISPFQRQEQNITRPIPARRQNVGAMGQFPSPNDFRTCAPVPQLSSEANIADIDGLLLSTMKENVNNITKPIPQRKPNPLKPVNPVPQPRQMVAYSSTRKTTDEPHTLSATQKSEDERKPAGVPKSFNMAPMNFGLTQSAVIRTQMPFVGNSIGYPMSLSASEHRQGMGKTLIKPPIASKPSLIANNNRLGLFGGNQIPQYTSPVKRTADVSDQVATNSALNPPINATNNRPGLYGGNQIRQMYPSIRRTADVSDQVATNSALNPPIDATNNQPGLYGGNQIRQMYPSVKRTADVSDQVVTNSALNPPINATNNQPGLYGGNQIPQYPSALDEDKVGENRISYTRNQLLFYGRSKIEQTESGTESYIDIPVDVVPNDRCKNTNALFEFLTEEKDASDREVNNQIQDAMVKKVNKNDSRAKDIHPNQNSKSNSKEVKKKLEKEKNLTNIGIVDAFLKDKEPPFGFIRNENPKIEIVHDGERRKDGIYFNFESVQSNGLYLVHGDEVEYTLFINKKHGKSKAVKVMIRKLKDRRYDQLNEYLSKVEEALENESSNCLQFLSSETTWKQIAERIAYFQNDDELLKKFLNVLLKLKKTTNALDERFRQMLLPLTYSKFFSAFKNGRLMKFIITCTEADNFMDQRNDLELVQQFLLMVAQLIPEKRAIVIGLLKPMMIEPNEQTAQFLYKLLKTVSSGNNESIADLDWKDLPLILKKEEIFDADLSYTNLSPVKYKGAYESPDAYMDVYVRLLREDCFEKLKKSIKELINGTLDIRDMSVYKNVALVGISARNSTLYLALKLTSCRVIKNWDTCSNLMYGNLLCITIGGDFQAPIWVTVVSRDMLKTDSIVVVQTCWEWNSMNDADILVNLISSRGSVLMVESPSYYQAFQPVLKSLQSMEPENISFVDELVYLQMGPLPHFLQYGTTFDAGIVYKSKRGQKILLHQFIGNSHDINDSVFDKSQETAVQTALQSRIGIVQGPPGCGKSFMGVQMLRLFLSLSTLESPKVLVLTYKNHALDEFLKSIMGYIKPEEIVRLGGRCKDEELENITLNKYKKSSRKSGALLEQIKILQDDIGDLKEEIEVLFIRLNDLMAINYVDILNQLSAEQVDSLLHHCDWKRANVSVKINEEDDSGFQIANSNRKSKVTLNTIDQMQRDPERYSNNLDTVKVAALKQWLPEPSVFSEVETSITGKKGISINLENLGTKKKNGKVVQTYEVVDDKDIDEIQNERLAAVSKTDYTVKGDIRNTLKMVSYNNVDDKGENAINSFSSDALRRLTEMNLGVLRVDEGLWDMSKEERVYFVQLIVSQITEEARGRFEEIMKEYAGRCKQKEELENQHVASILQDKKVIGMTMTGAALNQLLLREVRPQIVIVEEAAEVLEPQLVAAIGSWTEYMLLIGDHQQLRPPVESYKLRKDFNFDISMMERLINNKMEYSTLEMQNRQRPELADLLKDIYPFLGTNFERVAEHKVASCLCTSAFFWHHVTQEISDRSFSNEEEAKRAVKLALFLVQQGYNPDQITILGAYQGQIKLIRELLRKLEKDYEDVLNREIVSQTEKSKAKEKDETMKKSIKVHTIDMYQGDENDFVIVSLVRSNTELKIGFVGELNRRCVAQSRARCGTYFIGNEKMFIRSPKWSPLMKKLQSDGNFGDSIQLKCHKHPSSHYLAKTADDITLKAFCSQDCNETMSCQKHRCNRKCQPPHQHKPCPIKVQFVHLFCGHADVKKCEEDETTKKCKVELKFNFDKCGHPGKKLCHEEDGIKICKFREMVTLPCGHKNSKECCEDVNAVKCNEKCARVRNCKHPCEDHACSDHEAVNSCKTCEKLAKIEAEKKRKQEEQQRKKLNDEAEKEIGKLREELKKNQGVDIVELDKDKDAGEYLDVSDQVLKFIQPGHNWYPTVTKIQRVTNYKLKIRWFSAKKNLFDPQQRSVLKFHGTSEEGVKGITTGGFILPQNPGMYGAGCYFASDSSKSAQKLYTKNSNKLLLCDVLIGKTHNVKEACPNMDATSLKVKRCDSVFAPRGTAVRYDEYVVFNPDQAYPRYIISYSLGGSAPTTNILQSFPTQTIFKNGKKTILPKRQVDLTDPLDAHFSFVEARFLRMLNARGQLSNHLITKVEFYINPNLQQQFKAKQKAFQSKYGANHNLAKAIFGFHGTKSDGIVDTIMNSNFLKSASGKFGAGVYFSEQPAYTFGYGGQQHLIMAQILPGKTLDCGTVRTLGSGGCNPSYDSHGGFPQPDGTFNEVVIFDTDQILPCYVIYFQ